jgi:hypothetical protein
MFLLCCHKAIEPELTRLIHEGGVSKDEIVHISDPKEINQLSEVEAVLMDFTFAKPVWEEVVKLNDLFPGARILVLYDRDFDLSIIPDAAHNIELACRKWEIIDWRRMVSSFSKQWYVKWKEKLKAIKEINNENFIRRIDRRSPEGWWRRIRNSLGYS